MKITKVEVFRLPTANSKQNSPIGCRIHTDVGICGDGEAGMAYGVGGSGAFGMVCDLAELIIGMDPLRTEFIWETMYKRTFWGQNGGPVVFSGIAAIDVALWDIKGKYFNVPATSCWAARFATSSAPTQASCSLAGAKWAFPNTCGL